MPGERRQFLTPGASAFRHSVETRSATAVVFMHGLPKAVPQIAVIALLAGGILLPGPAGAACLATIFVLFGWLLFLSWPSLPRQARAIRIGVLAFMAFGVVLNLTR